MVHNEKENRKISGWSGCLRGFPSLAKTYISHKPLREDGRTHPLLTTTDSPFEACSRSVVWLVASLPPVWTLEACYHSLWEVSPG